MGALTRHSSNTSGPAISRTGCRGQGRSPAVCLKEPGPAGGAVMSCQSSAAWMPSIAARAAGKRRQGSGARRGQLDFLLITPSRAHSRVFGPPSRGLPRARARVRNGRPAHFAANPPVRTDADIRLRARARAYLSAKAYPLANPLQNLRVILGSQRLRTSALG